MESMVTDENEDGDIAADDEAEENADENEAEESAEEIDGGDDGVDGDGNSIADDAAVDTAESCNLDGGNVLVDGVCAIECPEGSVKNDPADGNCMVVSNEII